MRKFGLIGKNIDYSFSKTYFNEKFKKEEIDAVYDNYDCQDPKELKQLFANNDVTGFNVTIPYKQDVMQYMAEMNKHALAIGAVNTIKKTPDGKYKGYNTDFIGFSESIKPYLKSNHKYALILGTGGAAKAIMYSFDLMDISYKVVSRKPKTGQLSYEELNGKILSKYHVIVNCTPLGTFPNIKNAPQLPYHLLSSQHLLFDLVYNPEETQFMKNGKANGAQVCNGYQMLKLQAEAAWNIWN